jgi:hypothetical protein
MRILLTIAAIALAGFAVSQDKADLSPRQKLAAIAKYRLVAKIADREEIKGTVETKIAKAKDNKPTEAEWKVSDMLQVRDGIDNGGDAPEPLLAKLDKHGLPEALSVKGNGAFYVAFSLASYLPAKDVAVGESFKIDWHGKGDAGLILGSGKLEEIKTENGVKIAVVKFKVEVTPADEHEPATIEVVSEFNLADGSLIKSSMTGLINGATFSCSVSLVK